MEEKIFKILVAETDANFNKLIALWLSKEEEFNTVSVFTFDMAKSTLAMMEFDLVIVSKDLSNIEMLGISLLPYIPEKNKIVFVGDSPFNLNLKTHRRIGSLVDKSKLVEAIIPEVRGLLES